MEKVYIKTFGCQMNVYDSDKIFDILYLFANFKKTNNIEESDFILLNTCSIREKADEKVFSYLGRIRKIKKKNSDLLIGVCGCLASRKGKYLVSRFPYVNFIFGPQTIHRLPEMINEYYRTGSNQIDISFTGLEKFNYIPFIYKNNHNGLVSIMEGCNKYCSYCIVPYTRGIEISRPLEDILMEIIYLSKNNIKEITLLGQNVNAYCGKIYSNSNKYIDFSSLIECISGISKIKRIRYMTSHPSDFTKSLINLYSKLKKLMNHVHLPVQHGSNRILKLMNRNYNIFEYKSIISELRCIRPDISITTDIIVGFPGETQIDVEKTAELIRDIRFDTSFLFIYSPRPGTRAINLNDNIPYRIKLDRFLYLQSILNKNIRIINKNMIGRIEKVLVNDVSKNDINELSGRTENNKVVNFHVPIKKQKEILGNIVRVKITDVCLYTLKGIIV